jgi:Leucine-rich repeat (LRR) protein
LPGCVRCSTLLASFEALAVGVWALAACTPVRLIDELELGSAAPAVFVEARPRLTSNELFGALRRLNVEVWIADDRRLGVRMHDKAKFEPACELLAELGHDIESLDLSYVRVHELDPLMWLRSIERLDLTAADADLQSVAHLTRLRVLSLVATDYASLSPLADLDRLEQLDLSDARANLIAVGQLSALRELQLQAARTAPRGFTIADGPGLNLAALGDLSELEILGLRHTKVRDWAELARLSTIVELDLSYTNFADLGVLEHFSELETLHLRRTAVANLEPLSRLPSLRYVDLRDCQLYDPAQLQQLRQQRPQLSIDD